MKYVFFFLGPLVAFAAGCNTAQVTTPAVLDAGPPCPELAPVFSSEDAGVCARGVFPGGCSGGVALLLNAPDASNVVPDDAGGYAPYCTIGFFIADPVGGDCLRAPSCECVPPDGGAEDAGDAGVVQSGTWQCFASQQ